MTAIEVKARETNVPAQLLYYAGWIGLFLLESMLWAILGLVLGVIAFVLGGIAWSLAQAAHTRRGEVLHGPILRATRWCIATGGPWVLAGVLVGGPPGVAAAATSVGRLDIRRLAVIASVFNAVLYAALHMARPDLGVPMQLAPVGLR